MQNWDEWRKDQIRTTWGPAVPPVPLPASPGVAGAHNALIPARLSEPTGPPVPTLDHCCHQSPPARTARTGPDHCAAHRSSSILFAICW